LTLPQHGKSFLMPACLLNTLGFIIFFWINKSSACTYI